MKDEQSFPAAQLKRFFLVTIFFLVLGAIPVNAQTANISWTASATEGTITYNVYRSERISRQADSFSKVSSGQSGTTFADTTVSHGHAYAHYVTAVNNGVESTVKSNIILVYVTGGGIRPTAINSSGQTTSPGRMGAKR